MPDYSDELRRDVADEAHFRTTDGFEALAKRRGLPVELIFEWHEEFHPAGPQPFDVMHCWVGTFAGNNDAFWSYVGDDDESGRSAMLADAGLAQEFDYDLLYAERFAAVRAIDEVLSDATFSTEAAEAAALARALQLGLTEANALVCSGDPSLVIADRGDFCGLRYLGAFADRKR